MCFPSFDEVGMACAGHMGQWGERSRGEHLLQPWRAVVRESFLVEVTSKLRCKALPSETEESSRLGSHRSPGPETQEARPREQVMWGGDGTGRDLYQWKGNGSTCGVSARRGS